MRGLKSSPKAKKYPSKLMKYIILFISEITCRNAGCPCFLDAVKEQTPYFLSSSEESSEASSSDETSDVENSSDEDNFSSQEDTDDYDSDINGH